MVLRQIRSAASGANRAMNMGKKVQKKSAKFGYAVVIYCVVFSVVMALSTLWNFMPTITAPFKYILTFALSLLMGIIHLKTLYAKIDWAQPETYFKEFAFTLLIPLIAGVISASLVHYLIIPGYGKVAIFISLAYFSFAIPYLWMKSYRFAMLIPEKVFSYWEYPQHKIEPSSEWERDKFVYANLIFSKSIKDETESTVKVRLPLDAKFGELIYMFVQDYNERRNPEFPIEDLYRPDGSIKWFFQAKKRFGTSTIDPNLTVAANKLKDEQVIIFGRALITTNEE
jgi:hypothetical protein